MAEIALTRTRGDRRHLTLEGVGSVRLGGVFSRAAAAEAGDRRWEIVSSGVLRRTVRATDPTTGVDVGTFRAWTLRRGGDMRWDGRALTLRAASIWRSRYVLDDGGRELVVVEGKGWGRRPVRVDVADPEAIDPGLLLFTCVVVHALTGDDSSAGSAAGAAS